MESAPNEDRIKVEENIRTPVKPRGSVSVQVHIDRTKTHHKHMNEDRSSSLIKLNLKNEPHMKGASQLVHNKNDPFCCETINAHERDNYMYDRTNYISNKGLGSG